MDPRLTAVKKRIAEARRIVAVSGGKGGIGKSLVASTLALTLAESGRKTGLLDLDLTGPCDHLILGAEQRFPREEFGIEPPLVGGVRFMSIACFTGDDPVPLRGADASNALIELLAITRWGELDVLVIDMPPGLGDAMLDMVRLFERAEYLIVSTSSRIVLETVRRTLRLLARTRSTVLGVVENMHRQDSDDVSALAREETVPFLGTLPFDDSVEPAIGTPGRLSGTAFAAAVRDLVEENKQLNGTIIPLKP
jgi:ATP-binding protein involved in chromosome partitioning